MIKTSLGAKRYNNKMDKIMATATRLKAQQADREIALFACENEILDIIDNANDFTRGDLQSAVSAQLRILINKIPFTLL